MKIKYSKICFVLLLFLIPMVISTGIIPLIKANPGNPIQIITPESIAYSGPREGYYPATYGFENDEDGINPSGWIHSEEGGPIRIVAESQDHNKVLEINDLNNAQSIVYNEFTPRESGTVEFWVKSNDVTKDFYMRLYGDGATNNCAVYLIINNDKFFYHDGTNHDLLTSISDNTWYHIRIDFECGTGNYMGLSQDAWRIFINGIEYGPNNFLIECDNINKLQFSTPSAVIYSTISYVDAVGYSWDPHYHIGDNLNEAISLSYTTEFPIQDIWLIYDGILYKELHTNNIHIPVVDDANHKIRIMAVDLNGNPVLSDEIIYSCDYIYINPDAKTLLLVHGWNGGSGAFDTFIFLKTLDLNNDGYSDLGPHYDNIITVDYYDNHNPDPEFDGNTDWTPIETIARQLRDFIIRKRAGGEINSHLDIVAHSMGGLVVRYMIKSYYPYIKEVTGITIDHVSQIGTPNHGTLLSSLLFKSPVALLISVIATVFGTQSISTQILQMAHSPYSTFIENLNSGDDTPYSKSDSGDYSDILWSTYRGHIAIAWWEPIVGALLHPFNPFAALLFPFTHMTDEMVDTNSVKLHDNDVINRGYFEEVSHTGMLSNPGVLVYIFADLMR